MNKAYIHYSIGFVLNESTNQSKLKSIAIGISIGHVITMLFVQEQLQVRTICIAACITWLKYNNGEHSKLHKTSQRSVT